jgi:hypothetical protein
MGPIPPDTFEAGRDLLGGLVAAALAAPRHPFLLDADSVQRIAKAFAYLAHQRDELRRDNVALVEALDASRATQARLLDANINDRARDAKARAEMQAELDKARRVALTPIFRVAQSLQDRCYALEVELADAYNESKAVYEERDQARALAEGFYAAGRLVSRMADETIARLRSELAQAHTEVEEARDVARARRLIIKDQDAQIEALTANNASLLEQLDELDADETYDQADDEDDGCDCDCDEGCDVCEDEGDEDEDEDEDEGPPPAPKRCDAPDCSFCNPPPAEGFAVHGGTYGTAQLAPGASMAFEVRQRVEMIDRAGHVVCTLTVDAVDRAHDRVHVLPRVLLGPGDRLRFEGESPR